MRAINLLVLATLAGCFIGDRDGDGIPDGEDCAPSSRVNDCGTDTGTGPAPDTDTDVVDTDDSADTAWIDTGDSGDTAEPCDSVTWYRDADVDGYGNPLVVTDACEQPDGYVADATDCDDADPTSYPGAPERCDSADNDCDGSFDENVSDEWHVDLDGDGYGSGDAIDVICDGASGSLVDNEDDCDDADADVSPEGVESCNDVDDDCDGDTDEDATDAPAWYADLDGDGYGDAGDSALSCDQLDGYVANSADCDDGDAGTSPGATETCNDADDDCDGDTDEDAEDADTWYADTDGDGYGDAASTEVACDAPEQYVADATDCDDGASSVYPGASESCNDVDDDCDGVTDESDAVDVTTWNRDADGDGYGDAGSTYDACEAPLGYVADATDCDDGASGVNPGATEVCNEVDDDCDGSTDPSTAADATLWYADADGDGTGDEDDFAVACDQPTGYVSDDSDCDDADAANFPGNSESCDGADNDCDGSVGADEEDVDGDGLSECEGDCDDANADVNPSATETCNFADDDCDGSMDEDVMTTYWADADGDGYGDPSSLTGACEDPPDGFVGNSDDCDDLDSTVSPGASETCDGADDDCDGTVDEADAIDAATWYLDEDEDGYGDDAVTEVACDQPDGYAADGGDCDENDNDVYPGAPDECGDGEDADCDGSDACPDTGTASDTGGL